ncbi:MAG TPA: MarR family transcriptional regulator [Acidimicrobiales bacterium]|jgi:DNA-binding MarR family transcriptional regulator|nr:MarR family transcriptional regulator [Acidimicrobiales bacterium]
MTPPARTTRDPQTGSLPGYLDEDQPLALFTRLQRVELHLERIQRETMGPIGVPFGDYTLLAVLRREGPPHRLPVTRIAELLVRPTGGITQLIDRIERRGLVARTVDPEDRRRVLVGLTPAGLELAATGQVAYDAVRARVLARLTPDQAARADLAVRELLTAFEADARAAGDV